MGLRLADRWVWDWWSADTGREFHVFYLQAPRSLGDELRRHQNATIGHAVSEDLRSWQVMPDALGPGEPGAWDDLATWTGSVIRHEGEWAMLYTGVSTREQGLVQRIGLALSSDLVTWRKHPDNPLSELDPRWYERLDKQAWRDQAWRDPWVFADPDGHGYHALITARAGKATAAGSAGDGNGVIGHAWSPDLKRWEARPPLSEPGEFGHLEVPQVERVGGSHVLLFSCARSDVSDSRRQRLPDELGGTFLTIGSSPLGPWDLSAARRLPVPDLYSARLIRDRSGDWQVMGFIDGSHRHAFAGELSDPIALASLGFPWP